MPVIYDVFQTCSIKQGDQFKQGVKAVCECGFESSFILNYMQGRGDDDTEVKRKIVKKFEEANWKVSRSTFNHLCPKCFIRVKSISAQKREMKTMADNKIVPFNEQPKIILTRDERYLISKKIDEVFTPGRTGYIDDWCDEKIARDLGVAVAKVALVRDDTFGPNINEASSKTIEEARDLIVQLKRVKLDIDPFYQTIQKLMTKCDVTVQNLQKFVEHK